MRVQQTQCKSLVGRNTVCQRVANDWKALPDAVVMSGSITRFNGRLGRWWKNHPVQCQNIRSPQVTRTFEILMLAFMLRHYVLLSFSF